MRPSIIGKKGGSRGLIESKNGRNHHMKIPLKLYAKLGKYLPNNASKNQTVIEGAGRKLATCSWRDLALDDPSAPRSIDIGGLSSNTSGPYRACFACQKTGRRQSTASYDKKCL